MKQPPFFFEANGSLELRRSVQTLSVHKSACCEAYGKTIKCVYYLFLEYNFLTTRRIYMKLNFLESSRGNMMLVSIWISFRALLWRGWCKINGEIRKIVVRKLFKKMIGQKLYGFSIIMERLQTPVPALVLSYKM